MMTTMMMKIWITKMLIELDEDDDEDDDDNQDVNRSWWRWLMTMKAITKMMMEDDEDD